jgi:hypothetical protein
MARSLQFFSTEAEAYKAGLEKFGNEPFLIKYFLDDDEMIFYPTLTVGMLPIGL